MKPGMPIGWYKMAPSTLQGPSGSRRIGLPKRSPPLYVQLSRPWHLGVHGENKGLKVP